MDNSLIIKLARLLPDKLYLSIKFYKVFGRFPNWKNPKTFSEKLQWLKLYDRNPEYTKMVDKYAVKEYVASILGEEYVIPTLGVWDKPEDIEWDKLPNQFVLKTTHGGGNDGVVICRDKNSFDRQKAIRLLNDNMKTDLYKVWREWPYKNVPKRVLAEKYINPRAGIKDLSDYKFFCFNGRCKYFKIDFDRSTNHHANYYNRDCKLEYFGEADFPPIYDREIQLPKNIGKMIDIADYLSSQIQTTFVRVDLYNVESHIYFGEITFYPASGMGRFTSADWDLKLGNLFKIC